MIGEIKANARCLGWGFLLAWVFCAFYSGSMDGSSMVVDAMGGGVARRLAVSVLPVGSAVVSLIVIVAAERRLGPPTNCRALVVAAPLAVAVATPMLFLPVYGFAATPLLFAVSAIFTGAGSALMWVMWGQLYARLPQDAVESCAPASAFVAALLSIATMAVVSVSATAGPRRVSLSFAYRWMCPLMVAGFAAIIVLGAKTGAFAAAGVGIASRFAFCVITQMYFASYAARGAATPVQSYAVGWLFVHVGDLLGLLVSFPLQDAIGASVIEPSGAAAVLIVALVAAVMLALNDETRFLSWETPQSYAGAVCAASASAAGMDAAVGAGAGAATGAGAAVDIGTVDAAGAAGEAKAGHLVLRPQSVRGAGGEGEGAAGETGVSAPVAVGASPSAISSQNPQPVDFIGQRVALLAREHKLTPRENEVFGLLAHGRSIPYVRDALIISRDTAATHAKHIYAKLDVHSRQELIDLVMSNEL